MKGRLQVKSPDAKPISQFNDILFRVQTNLLSGVGSPSGSSSVVLHPASVSHPNLRFVLLGAQCSGSFAVLKEVDLKKMEASTVTQYPATQQGGYAAANVDANGYPIGNSGGLNSESTTAMATEGSSYADPSMYNANQVSTAEGAADPLHHAAPAEGALASGSVVGHGYTTVEETHAASYGSFGDGINEVAITTSTETIQNGNASSEQQLEDSFGVSNEEERLWALVTANCLDFNAWTALIQETEKEDNILKIRKVYDSFLAEFPLCYGYWKKYADHESRLDSIDKVEEVYEQAVAAVTYSVDIWVHYCQFAISTHGEPESPDRIRRLFERGLAYVGTDYLSSPLWDEYINYEYALREWRNVAMIYTRILENPIQQLDRYLNSLKEFAASRPLGELRTEEESAALYGSVEITEQGVEGEVRPDDAKQTLTSASTGLTEAEELEKYMAVREEIYKKAKEFDSKIIHFETAIRRPYFHVKPLDDSELENWHNYLDFMERGDDFNKLVKLYERCLIACANYPEYWVRYVLCMEGSRSIELASNALARATQVFVKKQPDIHIFAARFKEHIGDVEGARAEYNFLYVEFSPVILEGIVRHANMEYRLGNKDAAFSVYDGAIASEQAKEYSQILPFIFVQYSRFCFLVAGDAEKSREILTEALEKVHLSKHLLEAVIHLESLLPLPKRVNYLDSFVEKFVGPSSDDSNMASTSDREEVSCIFLEFLDLFGDSQSIKKAENRHSMLFLRHRTTLVSRKRRSDDYLGSEKTKVLKTQAGDLSSSQSLMGSYPNAQNQWPASYGQNPAAWPPVPQAQGQQWASGYAPQGGYSAYGNYASYAHPQVPASVPQSTAYGAYPATSTAQAYPQQNYTQPSAAYAPQPAPTTQAYYSGYY